MGGRLLDWLGAGVSTDLPDPTTMVPGRIAANSTALFFTTDTKQLYVFDPSVPDWADLDLASLVALSTESIQDMIAAFLVAGTGINLNYDDVGNLLSISCTITQYTDEMAQDAIAALIAAGTDTGLAIVYDDAGNKIGFAINVATASDIWGGSLDTSFVTPKRLKDWRTPVSVAYGATITFDGSTGVNFYTTLTGNVIVANPVNFNPGQFGVIHFTQDATGSRVATFGSNWKFGDKSINGNVLSTAPNAVDMLHYYVRNDGTLSCFILQNINGAPARTKLDDLSNVDMSIPPTNGQALVYNSTAGKWNPGTVSGGGGGSAGTPPTIVQFGYTDGTAGTAVTLGAAPTAGNLLIAMGTYPAAGAGAGWTQLLGNTGGGQWSYINYKIAGAGESATQTPGAATGTDAIAMWEIHGQNASPFVFASISVIGGQLFSVTDAAPGITNALALFTISGDNVLATFTSIKNATQDCNVHVARGLAAGHSDGSSPIAQMLVSLSSAQSTRRCVCMVTT